jgi:hypothetical protein
MTHRCPAQSCSIYKVLHRPHLALGPSPRSCPYPHFKVTPPRGPVSFLALPSALVPPLRSRPAPCSLG